MNGSVYIVKKRPPTSVCILNFSEYKTPTVQKDTSKSVSAAVKRTKGHILFAIMFIIFKPLNKLLI